MTEWCWAAVTSSTTVFFGDVRAWRQCEVASDQLGEPQCCAVPLPACNRQWLLENALSRVGHFNRVVGPPNSLAAIAGEIDARRPIAERIQWRGNGAGHFIVVEGYDLPSNMCFLRDSLYGPSVATFDAVRSNYRGSGVWTHSYLLA